MQFPHHGLLSFPLASERGGIKWGRGPKCLALGSTLIGRIRREVDYLSQVSHNCLELLLGYCKHAVINSWTQCLESLGKGSIQNTRKHLRHASVETSLVPRSSPSGACEDWQMSFTHRYPTSTWQPPCPCEIAANHGELQQYQRHLLLTSVVCLLHVREELWCQVTLLLRFPFKTFQMCFLNISYASF